MNTLRHANQVAITDDTGTIRETLSQRTQQAWELHCAGEGAK